MTQEPLMVRIGTHALLVFCLLAPRLAAEEVSMTAYYPSPRGMYEELRTTNNTYLATTEGQVGIGTNNPQDIFHIAVDAAVGRRDMLYTVAGNAGGTDHPRLRLQRARNTIAGPGAVQLNDDLAAIRFDGWDGADYNAGARLEAEVDGVVGPGSIPGRLMFATGAVGVAAPVERMRIDSQGRVGIGTTTPDGRLQVEGDAASGTSAGVFFTMYGDDAGEYPRLVFERARGSLITAPAVVAMDDQLGLINFRGFHGAADGSFSNGASVRIRAQVDGPAALDDVPGRLIFETHQPASGGGITTERMRIDSQGRVGIGTVAPQARLQVEGLDSGLPGGFASLSPGFAQLAALTTNGQAANRGSALALGGGVDAAGDTRFAFGVIAGKKENAIADNEQGYLAFYTAPDNPAFGAIPERMRIDSGGRVGIGTMAPRGRGLTGTLGSLDVNGLVFIGGGDDDGPMSTTLPAQVGMASTDLAFFLPTFTTNLSPESSDLRLYIEDNPVDQFSIWGNSCSNGGCQDLSNSRMGHYFRVNGNAYHRGNVGIGTETPGEMLHVVGNVLVDGNITATGSITSSSDGRLKTDVVPLSGVLDKIAALQAVSYAWNETAKSLGYEAARPQIGMIAQEVETVYPELVVVGANGYRSVDYARMSAVLLEAVKELKEQSEALQARVKALEQERDSAQPLP